MIHLTIPKPTRSLLGRLQLAVFAAVLLACGPSREPDPPATEQLAGLPPGLYAHLHTVKGPIVARLFPDSAPKAVANFIGLANGTKTYVHPVTKKEEKGHYYDGILFYRIIGGLAIQTGDPTNTGRGGPGYVFDDEVDPNRPFDRAGSLVMASMGEPNTNGSQFLITLGASPRLDGVNTLFGEVVKGMETVDAISKVEINRFRRDRPRKDVTLYRLRVYRIDEKGGIELAVASQTEARAEEQPLVP